MEYGIELISHFAGRRIQLARAPMVYFLARNAAVPAHPVASNGGVAQLAEQTDS